MKITRERNTLYKKSLLSIGREANFTPSLYDKGDDFYFHITNFQFHGHQFSIFPCFSRFISLTRSTWYTMPYSSYEWFILNATRPINKLLAHDMPPNVWYSPWGNSGDLIKQYVIRASLMLDNMIERYYVQLHSQLTRYYINSWFTWGTWPLYFTLSIITPVRCLLSLQQTSKVGP